MNRPALLLVVGVVAVSIIETGLFVGYPAYASPFPRGEFPVRQVLLAQGTYLNFNGTSPTLVQFSVAAQGAILIGQLEVDHSGSVFLSPFEMYPSHVFPQCTAVGPGGGYLGGSGALTLDYPLTTDTGYGFGSQCQLWGNATVLEPVEIVYPLTWSGSP